MAKRKYEIKSDSRGRFPINSDNSPMTPVSYYSDCYREAESRFTEAGVDTQDEGVREAIRYTIRGAFHNGLVLDLWEKNDVIEDLVGDLFVKNGLEGFTVSNLRKIAFYDKYLPNI